MKFSQFGRSILAAVALTAMSLTISACATGHTVAFLYATSTKVSPGTIYAYKIDGASGTLNLLPDAPFPAGGRNPVALATTPNGLFLYVANHDDSSIVENAIGTDGKLYAQCTYNTPNGTSFPTNMQVDPTGKFLVVAVNYQPGFTNSVPGPGALIVYPIQPLTATASSTSLCTTGPGTLGTPVVNPGNTAISYFPFGSDTVPTAPTGLTPDAMVINVNGAVVVATSGKSSQQPGLTQIIGNTQLYSFTLSGTGALTATGTVTYPTAADIFSALASDSTGKYLYVTDSVANVVNAVNLASNGVVGSLIGATATGNGPSAIAINNFTTPHYMYISNYNDNTVSAYSVNATTGALTALPAASSVNNDTGSSPNSIIIDPAFGYFLYTGNYIAGNISGLQLDQKTGGLLNIQFTPFVSGGEPTALATTSSLAVEQSY